MNIIPSKANTAFSKVPHSITFSEILTPHQKMVWIMLDATCYNRETEVISAAKLAKNPATFWTFALKNRMSARGVPSCGGRSDRDAPRRSEKYRLVLHTAARLRFVEENGLAHSDFDFARYLACRLGHALGELVEVPSRRPAVLPCLHAIFMNRLQERRSFGPI